MRPDRIIVGEVRGGEALDMLQAMNTGHDGSLTTVHANSARDALHRLEMLVLMAGIELPVKAIREQIAGGFDLLVHIGRLVDGSRRVTQITEIAGMEGDVLTLQDLFVARAPEHRARTRRRLLGPLRPTGFGPGSSPSSPRTASSCRRRLAGRRVRRASSQFSPRSRSPLPAARRRLRLGADPPRRPRQLPARAGDGGRAGGQPPGPRSRTAAGPAS